MAPSRVTFTFTFNFIISVLRFLEVCYLKNFETAKSIATVVEEWVSVEHRLYLLNVHAVYLTSFIKALMPQAKEQFWCD